MNRLANLKEEVEKLYKSKNSDADPWVDWAYRNHVLVVASNASQLAKQKGTNQEFCEAGALLHDIADAFMHRDKPNHEEKSLDIAENLLDKCGYSGGEIKEIVHEIIEPHGCNQVLPKLLEGKILATADAMAHFQTDFYLYFCWQHYAGEDLEEFKKWVLAKIEKDFNRKIFFDDVKGKVRENYLAIKKLFSQS